MKPVAGFILHAVGLEEMFSEMLNEISLRTEKIGRTAPINQKDVLSLLERCVAGYTLAMDEIIDLLNSISDEKNRKLILEFSAAYKRPNDKEILLLPPLYFDSICENNCLYCDFNSNGIRLSHDEFKDEFDVLLNMGYRSIELVSSQDPEIYSHAAGFELNNQFFDIDKVVKYFALAKEKLDKNGGGMLTSNIPPVDGAGMRKLKDAGLECFLIWLETFNPLQYSKLHYKNGPKANQAFRLDSFDLAIEAGIEHTAGAFLKGLYDWRKEEAALYCMDKYLKERYGRGFSIIGTPRLKGLFAESSLVRDYSVSDDEYELNIALDRILYDGILWLQTRESFAWNRHLINRFGGGVILTLSSSTAPGGYSKPSKARAQFPVHSQKLSDSINMLEKDGFRVHLDWNSKTLSGLQRAKRQTGLSK